MTPTLPTLPPSTPREHQLAPPPSGPLNVGLVATPGPARRKHRRPWPIRLLIWAAFLLALIAGAFFVKGFLDGYQQSRATSAELSAVPTNATSYQFTFDFVGRDSFTVAVDWPTQNYILTTQEGELRTIGDRRYDRPTGESEWTEVTWTDDSASNKLLPASIVFMEEMRPFLVSSTPGANGGGAFVVDAAPFSTASPDNWRAWSGLFSDNERPDPVPGDKLSIELTALADGVVQSATIVFLPSGDTTTYTLDWSDEQLIVDLPE